VEFEEEPGGCLKTTLKVIEKKAEAKGGETEGEAAMQKVAGLFEKYVKYSPEPSVRDHAVDHPGHRARTADRTRSRRTSRSASRRSRTSSRRQRARAPRRDRGILENEIEKLRVDKRIHNRVKKQMEKAQKEYYLNEKMKAIQQELGRRDDRVNEIEEFRGKIEAAKMPKEAREKAPPGAQASRGHAALSPRRRPSRATTSNGCSPCRGRRSRASCKDIARPSASSTRTTSASRR
jgi:ATP-dependent Lon protease